MTTLIEATREAWGALEKNRLRSVLTAGGVVVGIFFVLVTGWVLAGLDRSFVDSFSFFGENVLYVDRFSWGREDPSQVSRPGITTDQYQRVRHRLRESALVVPMLTRPVATFQEGTVVVDGGLLYGTTHEYFDMFGGRLAEGRALRADDIDRRRSTIVLGHGIASRLGERDGLTGRTVRIGATDFEVVGVLPRQGTMLLDFVDDVAMIPISTYRRLYGESSVLIGIRPDVDIDEEDLTLIVAGVMRAARGLGPDDDDNFGINSQDLFDEFVSTTRTIVWGVGLFMTGLAFLVGSIGIMNIMFVSVSERTKEIGIRKAIGAPRSAILGQFLVESTILALLGAVIGIVLTSGLVAFREELIAGVVDLLELLGIAEQTSVDTAFLPTSVPIDQIGIALVVAFIVGVAAGFVPAFRASRLSPVDALRAG